MHYNQRYLFWPIFFTYKHRIYFFEPNEEKISLVAALTAAPAAAFTAACWTRWPTEGGLVAPPGRLEVEGGREELSTPATHKWKHPARKVLVACTISKLSNRQQNSITCALLLSKSGSCANLFVQYWNYYVHYITVCVCCNGTVNMESYGSITMEVWEYR